MIFRKYSIFFFADKLTKYYNVSYNDGVKCAVAGEYKIQGKKTKHEQISQAPAEIS